MLDNLDIKIEWVNDDWSVIECDDCGEYYEIECGWNEKDETLNKEYGGFDDGFDNDFPHVRRAIFALISKDGEHVVWRDKFEEAIHDRAENRFALFSLFKLQEEAKKRYMKNEENSF